MMTSSARTLLVRLLFLVLALGSALLLSSARVDAQEPLITMEYRVAAGDTLWDIAGSFTAPGEDTRVSIDVIKELNDLETSSLRPGQTLVLPVG